jgi:predicted nucleic acid-binding Zn finger protein
VKIERNLLEEVVMEKTLAHNTARTQAQTAAQPAAQQEDGAQREKRARTMAALGLVTNRGSHYQVMGPRQGRTRVTYTVWRARDGKPHCTCPEFRDQAASGANFYCEHILAVKYAVLAQKQDNAAAGDAAQEEAAQPDAPQQAAAEVEAEVEEAAPFEAPDIETPAPARAVVKEAVMKRKKEEANEMNDEAVVEPRRNEPAAPHRAAEGGATVVPLAFTATLRQLKQPVDARLVKTREGWTDRDGQKHMVEYVEWHTVADILDRVAPDWSHAVRNITQIGDVVAVTASITIGGVTREGVGTGNAENETGIKKAEHDALKRAAVKFGIARDLYQRESEVIEREGGAAQGEFPRNPLAKSVAELATPKQLGMIRALCRELEIDADKECQRVLNLNCRIEELSRRAASSFIDHLKRQSQEEPAVEQAAGMRRAS